MSALRSPSSCGAVASRGSPSARHQELIKIAEGDGSDLAATLRPEYEERLRMSATSDGARSHGGLAALSVAALGVVYGDIGTSPLYAIRECFHGPHAIQSSRGNVLGVLSLIFWSLILVVSVKYLAYVLRADHRGE